MGHRQHDRAIRQVDPANGHVDRGPLSEQAGAGERDGERQHRGVLDLDHGQTAGVGHRPDPLDRITLGDLHPGFDDRGALDAALPNGGLGCWQVPTILGGHEPLHGR